MNWLTGVLAILCAVCFVVKQQYATIPADTQKQSQFLRAFNPILFLNSVRSGCGGASSLSASAGSVFFERVQNVKYARMMEPELCGAYQYDSMITALHQDVLSGLGSAGCQVSLDQLTVEKGIRVVYRCGNRTTGLLTAEPPRRRSGTVEGRMILPIRLDEEWGVRRSDRSVAP